MLRGRPLSFGTRGLICIVRRLRGLTRLSSRSMSCGTRGGICLIPRRFRICIVIPISWIILPIGPLEIWTIWGRIESVDGKLRARLVTCERSTITTED
jgi:hypothetical protein